MKVELEKKDLIIMVKGASPSFEVMNLSVEMWQVFRRVF